MTDERSFLTNECQTLEGVVVNANDPLLVHVQHVSSLEWEYSRYSLIPSLALDSALD